MTDVDKRVVQFEFDNKRFERNAKQSMNTLEKLKTSLNFKENEKSIDSLSVKISALEVVAVTAISRITNKVIDLGTRLIKSLSVDNISSGWTKFGDKAVAVATMASQSIKVAGKSIDDYVTKMDVINEQLDKLNWYTDETSYSFIDMVNTIGKFTATGKDLDASVEAMMGIANWAALSGTNTTNASRAMYQLAQAMSKGYMMLQDWQSIQNVGMDTREFRQSVLDTAVAIGEMTKQGENYISKTGTKVNLDNFTTTLSSKWFTGDILIKTLNKYSKAVDDIFEISEREGLTASQVVEKYGDSLDEFGVKAFKAAQEARTFSDVINATKDAVSTGWMNTAEYIFGGYDESKKLWTDLANELYDVFAAGGDFRNDVLDTWNELEGRADLFAHTGESDQGAFWNIYDAVVAVVNLVKTSFGTIFDKTGFESDTEKANSFAESLKELTSRIQIATYEFKETIENSERLQNIINGVTSIFGVLIQIVQGVRYALNPLITLISELSSDILDVMSSIGLAATKTDGVSRKIIDAARTVSDGISYIIEKLNPRGLFNNVINIFNKLGKSLKQNLESVSKGFKSVVGEEKHMAEFTKGLIDIISLITNTIKKLINIIDYNTITNLETFVIKFYDILGKIFGVLSYGPSLFGKLLSGIYGLSNGTIRFSKVLEYLGSTFNKVGEYINNFFEIFSKGEKITSLSKGRNNSRKMAKIVLTEVNGYIETSKSIEALPNIFDKIKKTFTSFYDRANEIFPILNDLKQLGKSLTVLFSSVVKVITTIINTLSGALNFIASFDPEDFFKKLESWLPSIAILATIVLILSKLYGLSYIMLLDIKKLSLLFDSMAGWFDAKRLQYVGMLIESIGKAILLIGISITIMASTIMTMGVENVWQSVGIIAIFISLFAIFSIVLSKLSHSTSLVLEAVKKGNAKTKKFNANSASSDASSMSSAILAVGAFMLILATSFKIMDGVSKETLSFGLKLTAIMLGIIGLISVIVSIINAFANKKNISITEKGATNINNQSKQLQLSMLSFIGIGYMIKKYAEAIKELSSLGDENQSTFEKIGPAMIAIGVMFTGLSVMIGMISHSKMDGKELKKSLASLGAVITSVIALAFSIKIMSDIPWYKMIAPIVAIGILFGILFEMIAVAVNGKRKLSDVGNIFKGLAALIGSLASFAITLAILSAISPERLWPAAGVIGSLLGILTAMIALIRVINMMPNNSSDSIVKSMYSLSVMITSLLAVALSMLLVSNIDPQRLWSSWGAIAATLSVLSAVIIAYAVALKLVHGGDGENKSASMLSFIISLSVLMLILAGTLAGLSFIDPESLKNSSMAIIGLIGVLGFMFISMSKLKTGNGKTVVAGIISMMLAITELVGAIILLKDVKMENIIAVAASISGFLLSIAGAFAILKVAKVDPLTMIAFAGSLVIMAIAIGGLLAGLSLLEPASLLQIAYAIGIVTLSFIGLAVLSKILVPSILTILGLSAALMITGISLMAIGAGLNTIASAMIPFIESMGENLDILLNIITSVLTSLLEFMVNNNELILNALTSMLSSLLGSIINNSELILNAITTMLSSLLGSIVNSSELILNTITTILSALIQSITNLIPELEGLISKLLTSVLNLVNKFGPVIIKTVFGFINTIFDEFEKNIPIWSDKLGSILHYILQAMIKWVPTLMNDVLDIVLSMLDLLIGKIPVILTKITIIFLKLLYGVGDWIVSSSPALMDALWYIAMSLLEGIWNMITEAIANVLGWIPGVREWIQNNLQFKPDKSATKHSVDEYCDSLTDEMKKELGINSPSKVTREMGKYLDEGLAVGISENEQATIDSAVDTMGSILSSMGDALSDGIDENSLTITPVVDLSNVEQSADDISSIMTSINGASASITSNLAQTNSRKFNRNKQHNSEIQNGNVTNNNSNDSYYTTFNVTTDDPEELARQTDEILQRRHISARLAKGGV